MAVLEVRVRGTYALLTHNPASMANGQSSAKKGARVIPTPQEEAEAGLYRLETGGFGLPGIAYRNSFLHASAAWKKPRSRSSIQGDLANMMVLEELVPLINDDDSLIESYEIDTRRVVIQGNGILRSRPKFPNWGGKLHLEYDETLIPGQEGIEIIKGIIADAGKRCGVGDYKPKKVKGLPGPFGRYALVSAELVEWQG